MLYGERLGKTDERTFAAKTEEALGLLTLLKPLLRKAGKLTQAEQETLTHTVDTAKKLLDEATQIVWNQHRKAIQEEPIAQVRRA